MIDRTSPLATHCGDSCPDFDVMANLTKLDGNFIRGGKYHEPIRTMLENQDSLDEFDLLDAGIELGNDIIISQNTPRRRFLSYLKACMGINDIVMSLNSPELSTAAANQLTTFIATTVAESFPLDLRIKTMLDVVTESIQSAYDRSNEGAYKDYCGWTLIKADILRDRYNIRYTTAKNVDNLYPIPVDFGESLAKLNKYTENLMQDTIKMREYGVKPAYTPASIGGVWAFYDGFDLEQSMTNVLNNKPYTTRNYVALAVHSPEQHPENLDYHIYRDTSLDKGGSVVQELPIQSDIIVYVQANGNLTLDAEGLSPLSAMLPDRPDAVAKIKAEIAANLFDLTVPLGVVSKMPSGHVNGNTKEQKDFNPILQLVLPRLRYFNQISKEDSLLVEEKPVREVRMHGVIWHVRQLPINARASSAAIQNAKECGITLGENETFVRSHERGRDRDRDHRVLGHKAIKRSFS